jgi:hypothetical protein
LTAGPLTAPALRSRTCLRLAWYAPCRCSATAPSKALFYLAGGLLAGWAVVLGLTGLRDPDFPGSAGSARLVMLTTGVLVVATATTAVVTAGTEGEGEGASSGAPHTVSGSELGATHRRSEWATRL